MGLASLRRARRRQEPARSQRDFFAGRPVEPTLRSAPSDDRPPMPPRPPWPCGCGDAATRLSARGREGGRARALPASGRSMRADVRRCSLSRWRALSLPSPVCPAAAAATPQSPCVCRVRRTVDACVRANGPHHHQHPPTALWLAGSLAAAVAAELRAARCRGANGSLAAGGRPTPA